MKQRIEYSINMTNLIAGLRSWLWRRSHLETGTNEGLLPVTKMMPEAIDAMIEHFGLEVGIDKKLDYQTQVRPWLIRQLTPGGVEPIQEVFDMIVLEYDYVYEARINTLSRK